MYVNRDTNKTQTSGEKYAECVVLLTDVTVAGYVCGLLTGMVWGDPLLKMAECKSCDMDPPGYNRAIKQLIITLCVSLSFSAPGSTCLMMTTQSVESQA